MEENSRFIILTEEQILEGFVRSRYPDAKIRHYAKLAIHVYCPLLDKSLSMYFHTEKEAWQDAVNRINKHENKLNHGNK